MDEQSVDGDDSEVRREVAIALLKIADDAFVQALAESAAACALVADFHIKRDVASLGQKIDAVYRRIFTKLDKPGDVARAASRWYWISKRNDQLMWLGWIEAEFVEDCDYTRGRATAPESEFDNHPGEFFYSHLSDCDYSDLIRKEGEYSDEAMLHGIAIAWLCQADDLMAGGKTTEALDAIADAFSAIETAAGLSMWNGASEFADEDKKHSARRGAIEKLRRDPKQKEKSFVFDCWQDWQKDPERYDSKAEFGRDMRDKCNHLRSQKKIEDWCREWEKKRTLLAE